MSVSLARRDLEELDRVEITGTTTNALVHVEDDLALLSDFIAGDAHALAVNDHIALVEITESNWKVVCGDIRHVFIDLDALAEKRMIDTFNEVASGCPEIAAVLILDLAKANGGIAVHEEYSTGLVRLAQRCNELDQSISELCIIR